MKKKTTGNWQNYNSSRRKGRKNPGPYTSENKNQEKYI